MRVDPHRIAQERSISIHGLLAAQLPQQPELLEAARDRVDRWLEDGSVARPYAEAWRRLLTGELDDLRRFLVDPGERARTLRQVSPFAGLVDPATRWRIWNEAFEREQTGDARQQGGSMIREQLEHLIRASASIADDSEIVIIGSQAILGRYRHAPSDLLVSNEADVFPRNHPERADLIDGAIGELSTFHATFGYYAHGVGPETATLPARWEERLIAIQGPGTGGSVGLCLEPHDLVVSKYVAGREQDREFVRGVIRHRLVSEPTLLDRLAATEIDGARRTQLEKQVIADFQLARTP